MMTFSMQLISFDIVYCNVEGQIQVDPVTMSKGDWNVSVDALKCFVSYSWTILMNRLPKSEENWTGDCKWLISSQK